MFQNALVRPPSATFASGLTTSGLGAPDLSLALLQHRRYVEALESCGVSVTVLPPDDAFPDSTFVEDTAVVAGRRAVVTRPGAPSRRGETGAVAAALGAFFSDLPSIEAPGTVDGGDVCLAGDRFLIGISDRTDEVGARQLARLVEEAGFSAGTVDVRGVPGLLHLKSGIAFLGDGAFLCTRALASHPALLGARTVVVPDEEAYAANAIEVNGKLLVAAGFPRTEKALRGLGFAVLPLDVSEFRKMDGGLSCLSIRF
ncbi:hypothetical protein FBQ97_08050 [Acidobacteria bacterium ACD]|nr:MAG: hypothetical protein EDX89_16605 [Acidobacteriota bacterium]MDL1949747.1 hypothetical protein [Acidobacteria bacterium ACD]